MYWNAGKLPSPPIKKVSEVCRRTSDTLVFIYGNIPLSEVAQIRLLIERYRYIGIDILRTGHSIIEYVDEHGKHKPVAVYITRSTADPVLDERHDAAAYHHHHEYARSLGAILAQTLGGEL